MKEELSKAKDKKEEKKGNSNSNKVLPQINTKIEPKDKPSKPSLKFGHSEKEEKAEDNLPNFFDEKDFNFNIDDDSQDNKGKGNFQNNNILLTKSDLLFKDNKTDLYLKNKNALGNLSIDFFVGSEDSNKNVNFNQNNNFNNDFTNNNLDLLGGNSSGNNSNNNSKNANHTNVNQYNNNNQIQGGMKGFDDLFNFTNCNSTQNNNNMMNNNNNMMNNNNNMLNMNNNNNNMNINNNNNNMSMNMNINDINSKNPKQDQKKTSLLDLDMLLGIDFLC